MSTAAPRVFISYSHDSQEHKELVLNLSERLRADGLDAAIDQYVEAGPPEGWPRWMDEQLRASDFVLLVCTPTYRKRVEGREEAGKGRGVQWEGNLVYQYLYNASTRNERFIPVLFPGAVQDDIPMPLQGASIYVLDGENGYDALYRRLTGQDRVRKGDLGHLRPLPPGTTAAAGSGSSIRRGEERQRKVGCQAAVVISIAATVVATGLWLSIRPPSEYDVRVTVVDPEGRPVNDAQVTSSIGGEVLHSASGWDIKIPSASKPADGRVVIVATVPAAFLSGEQEVKLDKAATFTARLQLKPATGATLHGIVVDSAQRAVPGVCVTIIGFPDFAITGVDGGFTLPAHAADGQMVEVRVEKHGYSPTVQGAPAGRAPATIVIDR
jgi:hypothetical protein